MEDYMLDLELKGKKREEFDFRGDFVLVWKRHDNPKVRENFAMRRGSECGRQFPAMFPDVQMNYTDNPVIFYLVPKDQN